jgi:hypothetical protein
MDKPMMEQQMELFRRGGLNDEGGEIDEVSGNEVPVGGTKKGVRDDVPAMVSEGEFVFPEDVVRYIGLDKLMQLRQQAKMGLKTMEAMGQMGNGDEATIPDDLPFDMADLIIVAGDTGEELEMQEGGFVTRPTTARRTEQQPTYAQPPAERPPEFRSTRALTPAIEQPQRSNIDFNKIMGDANIELKEYRNKEGQTLLIPFISGSPIFSVPDGYTLYTGEDSSAITNEVASKVNEISQVQEKDTYEVPDFLKPQPPEPTDWANLSTDELIDELRSVTGTARLITKGAMLLMGPVGLAGNLMMSHQDKKIVSAIDAALAKGGLSAEDKTTLTAAKEELTKSGMLSFLDPIIDGVANVLGVPEEQVNESVSANVESGAVEPKPEPEVVAADPYAGDVVKTDVRTRDPRIGGGVPDTYISDGPSGPAIAEATFGAPLGDPLGGTPPPVDELVFTPTPQQQTQTPTPVKGDRAGILEGLPISTTDQPAPLSNVPVAGDRAGALSKTTPYGGVSLNTQGRAGDRAGVSTQSNIQLQDPYADLDKYPLPPPAPISGPKQSELDSGVATVPQQTYTSTGAQMQASQKALEDIVPKLPDPATVPVLSQPKPAPITTGKGYDTSLGQDFLSYAVTPEQVAYSTSVSKGQEDPYDPRGIMPVSEQVTKVQPVTTQAQVEAPSMAMPDAFVEPLPVPSRRTSEKIVNRPMTVAPPLIGSTQLDTDTLAPTVDTTDGSRIKTDRGYVPTNEAKRAATAETVKTAIDQVKALGIDVDSPFATAMPQQPISGPKQSELDGGRATISDASALQTGPAVRGRKPNTPKTKSAAPDKSLRPKARPKTTEEKAAKKEAAKPKRDTGSKSNRLDQSNPNTEINFNEHLADWEKEQARSNPALAQHFIITANRRENDKKKTGKDPADKVSAKKHDESGGLGGFFKGLFGAEKGGLATRR